MTALNEELWSDREVALLRALWTQGLSARAIGARLRRGKNAVLGKRQRLGLPQRAASGARWNNAEDVGLQALLDAGLTLAAAARELGREKRGVAKRAARLGLATRPQGRPPAPDAPFGARPETPPDDAPPTPWSPPPELRLGRHCQWIEGSPSADDACKCGDPVWRWGAAYCGGHRTKSRRRVAVPGSAITE